MVMQEFPDELIDQLLAGNEDAGDLTGPDGLINQLRKRLIERAASAELSQHLGYVPGSEPPQEQKNRRNGAWPRSARAAARIPRGARQARRRPFSESMYASARADSSKRSAANQLQCATVQVPRSRG